MGRPLVNTTIIRIAAVILAIKGLWILLGVPGIDNAIINFCTVGLIPGTDISVNPTITFILLPAMLLAIVAIIFRSNLNALIHSYGFIAASEDTKKPVKPSKKLLGGSKSKKWLLKLGATLQKQQNWIDVKTQPFYEAVIRAAISLSEQSIINAVRFWRWIEPYLRRFDMQLEAKIRQYETASISLAFGSEMVTTIRRWGSQAKDLLDYNFIDDQLHK